MININPSFQTRLNIISRLSDKLRGSYKKWEYADVILPLVVLVRFNQANGSAPLKGDAQYLTRYINGLHQEVKDIFEKFNFKPQLTRLEECQLLEILVEELNKVNLHPDEVSNLEMGRLFEHLIFEFHRGSNDSGEHYTPCEVINLMVKLLFGKNISTSNNISIYDPACGTGGMLTGAKDYILSCNEKINPEDIQLFGQEINSVTYALAKADFLLRDENLEGIKLGNTLSNDKHLNKTFNYMLSNPPYGLEWKTIQEAIKKEHKQGFAGRFGAGLPRVSDGSFLFVQHLLSKMSDEPSRIVVVLSGSPLFNGDAGSGESNIRRWIIENDLLEGIIALPDSLFYNTQIPTYLWLLTNSKSPQRKGKIQLVNAVNFFAKVAKGVGKKRKEITQEQCDEIADIYHSFSNSDNSLIFDNHDFGFRRITVERPLRLNFSASPERLALLETKIAPDVMAALKALPSDTLTNPDNFLPLLEKVLKPYKLKKAIRQTILKALTQKDPLALPFGSESDPDLRDYENIELTEDVFEYLEKEIKPHQEDAWIADKEGVVGYTINFNRHFFKPDTEQLRPVPEIMQEIINLEREIAQGMNEFAKTIQKLYNVEFDLLELA